MTAPSIAPATMTLVRSIALATFIRERTTVKMQTATSDAADPAAIHKCSAELPASGSKPTVTHPIQAHDQRSRTWRL
jgi:hypothetical protein